MKPTQKNFATLVADAISHADMDVLFPGLPCHEVSDPRKSTGNDSHQIDVMVHRARGHPKNYRITVEEM
jgi:hypothetical protein